MRVENGFQPIPYPNSHPYTEDPVLPSLIQRLIPNSCRGEVEADLVRFGHDIGGYIRDLSTVVSPPKLTQYDQWGRRVDRLDTSEGWRKLKNIATREGLVAIHHDRKYGEFSRIYGFAKSMIFAGDSHVIMCPLSMTDGAARVLELFGTDDMKREVRTHLVSRDPSIAWTSGQWMTERPGGSDVSQTETTAVCINSASTSSSAAIGTPYILNGFKWFSSASDSHIALALARTGSPSMGARSLSLFLVPLRLPIEGGFSTSNGILVHRLKDKFGTHALPTAELSLNDTKAYLLSPLHQGVRSIAPLLNITRMHSSVGSIGYLSRAYSIARSYALVRSIIVPETNAGIGTPRLLKDTPLHMSVLAKVGVTYQALTHLTFGAIALLGKSECGTASRDEETRLRLLTPVVKAFVAEKGVSAIEDCMTSLGGQGYMEENMIGRLIRDGTVERIWEGTTSVLSLDLVRASKADRGVKPFVLWANHTLTSASSLSSSKVDNAIDSLKASVETIAEILSVPSISPFLARPMLFLFGHVAAALYLLEHVIWGYDNRQAYANWETDADGFVRWVEEGLDTARQDVQRAKLYEDSRERGQKDLEIIYGSRNLSTKLKL